MNEVELERRGYAFLSQFTVTLDATNRRIRLDREEGAAAAPRAVRRMGPQGSSRKRYGIMFPGINGNPLVVNGIGQGKLAKYGDALLSLTKRNADATNVLDQNDAAISRELADEPVVHVQIDDGG